MKPIEYQRRIFSKIDDVYVNFHRNAEKFFNVPKKIKLFWEKKPDLVDEKQIQEYSNLLTSSYSEWSQLDQNKDKLILISHHLSAINASLTVLASIEFNLENYGLKSYVLDDEVSFDCLTGTAIKIFKNQAQILMDKNSNAKLDNQNNAFSQMYDSLKNVSSQKIEASYTNLVNNILEYIINYNSIYNQIMQNVADFLTDVNFWDLFLEYINTYYLLSILLDLILEMPLMEDKITLEEKDKMVPHMKLFI